MFIIYSCVVQHTVTPTHQHTDNSLTTCGQLDRNRVAGNYDLTHNKVVIGWLPKRWSTQKFLVCTQPSFFSFRWEENHDRWPLFHICFLADVHRLGMRLSCDFTSTRVERPLVDLSVT